MSQSDVSKAEAADQRSEQTRSFVRRVRDTLNKSVDYGGIVP